MDIKKIIKEELTKLLENKSFNNWVVPSEQVLKREYKVEVEMKGNEDFDSEEEFLEACKNGKVIEITPEMDDEIDNRSQTQSKEELIGLVSSYRSWGSEFRNQQTVDALYDGFEQNKPMETPIVVDASWGRYVLAGNTRMDVAFQLGIKPNVLLIKSNN